MLALTATATITTQNKIIEMLRLQHPAVVKANTNRNNINLVVRKQSALCGGQRTSEGSKTLFFRQ